MISSGTGGMNKRTVVLLAMFCLLGGVVLGYRVHPSATSLPPLPRRPVADDFHDFVYESLAWDHLTWLGVHAQQNPNDVWSYQQIFYETKPDFVVEAGTSQGGGALVWATLLAVINPQAKVLTIDIQNKHVDARRLSLFQEKVEFFIGSSTSEAVFKKVSERVNGKKAIVILDSDHSRDHVLKEMQLYGDLVPVGSYLLVQDSDQPGAAEAIAAFMSAGGRSQGGATFEIERSRELLFFTLHPKGYLKRVK